MPTTGLSHSDMTTRRAERDFRFAWVSTGLIPVAFVVAMFVGEGLIDLLGYPSGGPDAPLWAVALVGGPTTLLAMTPAILAVVYGRRARREVRRRAAAAPAVIGGVACAYWVATFVLGFAQVLAG